MSFPLIEFHWQPFVGFLNSIFGKRIVFKGLDWSAHKLATVDEDSPFFTFDQKTVVRIVPNYHFNTVCILDTEIESPGRVVHVVSNRETVNELDGMLNSSTDRNWAIGLPVDLQCPVGDVDMMRAPVS